MLEGDVSFVKAVKDFFENGTHSRKVEIEEFKQLSTEDKLELRDLLIGQGYSVLEFPAPAATL